jgi:hypothetical protein
LIRNVLVVMIAGAIPIASRAIAVRVLDALLAGSRRSSPLTITIVEAGTIPGVLMRSGGV